MENERYIVALEISSSKVMAMIGRALPNGELEIIASERENCVETVRYGEIKNLEETSIRIRQVLGKLQRKPGISPKEIKSVYLGLSCRSLRSITVNVYKKLPDYTEITDDIIEELKNEALRKDVASSLKVLDAVPRKYLVGGRDEMISPRGAVGDSISVDFDLIVCRPDIERILQKTVQEKLGIPIKGIFITALTTGRLVLSNEQKRLGCMLVDMGAETTTVTIYKNAHLVYFATLPLGGRNITRDITSLNILEERAEEIKRTSGNAIPRTMESRIVYHGVSDADVSNMIVARSEEIVVNILEQINYAGLKRSDLGEGIVCIGGASMLNGILDLLANKSDLPVKRGKLPSYVRCSETISKQMDTIELISVLYCGMEINDIDSCLYNPQKIEEEPEEIIEEVEPAKKSKGWFSKFSGLKNMFGNVDDEDQDDAFSN